jgi:hypothetical protein
MTTQELLTRVYDQIGLGGSTFWPAAEVVANGLSPAMRLLIGWKPSLLIQRALVTLAVDQAFIDLRTAAPRQIRMQRVCLGDVRTEDPVLSQGREGDLRQTSLAALRGHREWFQVRRAVPSHWYTHGLDVLGIYPRVLSSTLLTLVYSADPTPLSASDLSREPEISEQYHPVIADVATCLLQAKEGAGEVEHAMQRLQNIMQVEPLKALQKTLRAQGYREQAMTARGQAVSA